MRTHANLLEIGRPVLPLPHLIPHSGAQIDGTTVEVALSRPVGKGTLALHQLAEWNSAKFRALGMFPIGYLPVVADSCGGSYFAPQYASPWGQ